MRCQDDTAGCLFNIQCLPPTGKIVLYIKTSDVVLCIFIIFLGSLPINDDDVAR